MYTPASLPKQFAYLTGFAAPKILVEALKWHGLAEVPGLANNPYLLAHAEAVGAKSYYHSDATPWCALEMSYWVLCAGYALPRDPLAAKSWRGWGTAVPLGKAKLGDVLVMDRPGGQHVTMYVGETATHYACYGGNQGDKNCIAWFDKDLFTDIRRCPWKIGQPDQVKSIPLTASGPAAGSLA
jgi:uncharacterized protein (TIGR02594 family)